MKIVIRYKLMDEPKSNRLTVNNYNALMHFLHIFFSNEWGMDIDVYINDVKLDKVYKEYDKWRLTHG